MDARRLRALLRRRRHGAGLRDEFRLSVSWILSDSGAIAVLTESAEHSARVEEVRAELPLIRDVDHGVRRPGHPARRRCRCRR
jgi:hypothetical protein